MGRPVEEWTVHPHPLWLIQSGSQVASIGICLLRTKPKQMNPEDAGTNSRSNSYTKSCYLNQSLTKRRVLICEETPGNVLRKRNPHRNILVELYI